MLCYGLPGTVPLPIESKMFIQHFYVLLFIIPTSQSFKTPSRKTTLPVLWGEHSVLIRKLYFWAVAFMIWYLYLIAEWFQFQQVAGHGASGCRPFQLETNATIQDMIQLAVYIEFIYNWERGIFTANRVLELQETKRCKHEINIKLSSFHSRYSRAASDRHLSCFLLYLRALSTS